MSFPFYSVPIAFGLAMAPHFVKVANLPSMDSKKPNGRSDEAELEGKLAKEKLAFVKRLGAAHKNGLEGFPLFATGVAACVSAGVPTETTSQICAVYLGSRTLYNIVYALPPMAGGMPRSLMWAVSTVSAISLWIIAGNSFSS